VGAFGEGIRARTPPVNPGAKGNRKARNGGVAGSAARRRDRLKVKAVAATDRAVAVSELADVGKAPTGDLLRIAGIAVTLVLGAAVLAGAALRRLRRGPPA
jgi:hypothetical protein